MKLLHIDSSVLGEDSVSRRLSAAAVAKFKAAHADLDIVYRDLVSEPLAHITPAFVAATRGPGAGAPPPADVVPDLAVLDEFLAADIVVIGGPMYNFGIASNLKAWLDRLTVPGRTFRYDADGPHGLCGNKRIVIASARGGIYTEGPWAAADHQETHLRTLLGFIGITDMIFLRAEGIARGAEGRAEAIAAGEADVAALAA